MSIGNSNVTVNLLNQLNRFITVANKNIYTKHYNRILNYFISEMRSNDQLFKTLYSGNELSGSYASGCKVSRPDEFDTIILFNLAKIKTRKYRNHAVSYGSSF